MIPINHGHEVRVQDFNEAESSHRNKQILFESSPSLEEKEEYIIPEIPPPQHNDDAATDHGRGNSPPDHVRISLFCTHDAHEVECDHPSSAQTKLCSAIQQVLSTRATVQRSNLN